MPWKETDPMELKTEFALQAIQTSNFSELCREFGISTKTGYKWKQRFLEYGLEGLHEKSRKPQTHSKQLSETVVCQIVRMRNAHPNWGPVKIQNLYERAHGKGSTPSLSSFKRVFEKAGYTKKRRRRPQAQQGRISYGLKATAPNDIWTVDFKGWWRKKGGSKCQPLTVRDEYSRYILCIDDLPDATTESVLSCFEKLFLLFGLPKAIRSDNGSPFACSQAVMGLSRLSC